MFVEGCSHGSLLEIVERRQSLDACVQNNTNFNVRGAKAEISVKDVLQRTSNSCTWFSLLPYTTGTLCSSPAI